MYKSIDGKQYAEILVNGKTGSRHIPLINSIPYIREYLMSEHPMPNNPEASLISGVGQSYGKHLSVTGLDAIYRDYKNIYFPVSITLSNLFDVAPTIVNGTIAVPTTSETKTITTKNEIIV